MKICFLTLLTTVAVLCSTCQSRPVPIYNRHRIHRLVVAGSTCYGPCAEFALDMDSSLSCAYYGGKYAKHEGYYRGKVSEQLWLEALKQLNLLNLDSLPANYEQNADMPLVQFIIYTSSGERHLLGSDGFLPGPLFRLYSWVARNDSALTIRPVNDSIYFGTYVQQQRMLPAPSVFSRDPATPAN